MRKSFFKILIMLVVALPAAFSQNLEVDGKAKITDMELKNTADSVVVVLPDGTLARRDASTLNSGWTVKDDSVSTLKHVSIGKPGTSHLFEIFIDSAFIYGVNDQSSTATGSPLITSAGSYGGQSFTVDTTGHLRGKKKPSKKQVERIVDGLHEIGKELMKINLV